MAINPGYKTFTFDGESSGAYGVYITGAAVYNAPEREVEMIQIPGRNGAFALDKGRFENIEITYPAGTSDEDQESFAEKISDFRNMLASRRGYCRLEDEYHPDEFRKAIYKSGLEVEPVPFQRAGEFEITFDCMPQRWLKSGETAVPVTSGDTLTNPTLFEASPLLEVEGYGTLNVNGVEIEIDDDLVGTVDIDGPYAGPVGADWGKTVYYPNIYSLSGDYVYVNDLVMKGTYRKRENTSYTITNAVITEISGYSGATVTLDRHSSTYYYTLECVFPASIYLRQNILEERKVTAKVAVTFSNGNTYTASTNFIVRIGKNSEGDAVDGHITFNVSGYPSNMTEYSDRVEYSGITIDSTATTFGHPTYIDCDLGEAYAIDNDGISSLNSYIALGSKLPTLSAGSSEITFDNTINDLKVIPRWWKI